jgi:oligopeptide/dipeptide ABC transporter ATP-binding protein
MPPLLEVAGLSIGLGRAGVEVAVLEEVGFSVASGEMLALVGESGCGKSMTALALMGLLPPQIRITGGSIRLAGRDLAGLSPSQMRAVRGGGIGMIFQEPLSSLNPVLPIGAQVMEAVRAHQKLTHRQARASALDLLARARLADPEHKFDEYPHRLSGGMCQRVVIAMALAGAPKLLIADEPTTALDVSVQAQILELIGGLQQEFGMGVLLITHDLGLVAGYADRVAVMYAGRIVETAPVKFLFQNPSHPYTARLLQSAPRLEAMAPGGRFAEIPGRVPPLGQREAGCTFAPRCDLALPACRVAVPPFVKVAAGHLAACLVAPGT